MNTFAQLCRVDDILLGGDIQNRQQLFDQVSTHLQVRYGLDPTLTLSRFGERERLGSTGLGQGVAVPHARMAELKEPLVLLVRPAIPLSFDAPDGKPVGMFFFLLVPDRANREHLQLLADAASLLCEQRVRDQLRSAATATEVQRLLWHWSA